MTSYTVVLVEPKISGNVGAVARLMKNFDITDLVLIDSVDIDDDALARAMHGKDILRDARRNTLEEELAAYDMIIGTSGIETTKDKRFIRKAETPETFAEDMKEYEGDVALLFGREDQGLSNEELSMCDRLIRIPTSEAYPILNLSHAVGIVLYEIFKKREEMGCEDSRQDSRRDKLKEKAIRGKLADKSERKRVVETFSDILEKIGYPDHKRDKTEVIFRRILGRATTTKWEYHRMMGVLSQIESRLDRDITETYIPDDE